MNHNVMKVISSYDGEKTSTEIAATLGLSPRYVRRIAKNFDLPRLRVGAQRGKENHQFVCGRRVDLDGYVLVTAPLDHPYSRLRKNRFAGIMFEHRLVLEQKLGRYLLPEEVVDHIDGLTLHNDPSNLRLFEKNGDHLRVTTSGLPKKISESGRRNIRLKYHQPLDFQPIDTYHRRRERGDIRLMQIFLAALSLGIDSPFLLGTHRHLKKVGIDLSSRSTIELALVELCQRWERDLSL